LGLSPNRGMDRIARIRIVWVLAVILSLRVIDKP
jgi:hypothetical protein